MPFDLTKLYEAAAEQTPRPELITIGETTLYVRQPTAKRFEEFSRLTRAQAKAQAKAEASGEVDEDHDELSADAMAELMCELIEDEDGERVFASIEEMKPLPQVLILRMISRFLEVIGVDAEIVDAEGN